ncbi:MAG: hypothetical protein AAB393_17390, partial [Bacteroidota bacterium]
MGVNTKPEVFIIESNAEPEEKDRFSEGRIISDVLRMMNKKVEYRYIRTEKELQHMAKQFVVSRVRYLHIACHGRPGWFRLTYDKISYRTFAEIIGPVIADRRLFLSACDIANDDLAREVYRVSKPYSITGPTCEMLFSDAAVVWASLYSLLFKHDPAVIKGGVMRKFLR